MKLFAFIALFMGCVFNTSVANAADKSELFELLKKIDLELRYYDQNPSVLDAVKFDLEKSLAALRGEAVEPQECTGFAYEAYHRDGFSNSLSLKKAKEYCSHLKGLGASLEVVKYFYIAIIADGYSNSYSLKKALEVSHSLNANDLGCIDEAFQRYKADGYSNQSALEKSADFCRL